MGMRKDILETVELQPEGELSIYISSSSIINGVAVSFKKGELESCIWVSRKKAQEFANKINKALEDSKK